MKFWEILGYALAIYVPLVTYLAIRFSFYDGDRREKFDMWLTSCLWIGGAFWFVVVGLAFGE